jgi:transcriptional regulator with XRE-family HTH domain
MKSKTRRVLAQQVGAALLHLRHERQLRQYMLADLAGMTKGMLSAFETGRQIPSLLSLVKLLAAMGISWQHFGRALADTSPVGVARCQIAGSPAQPRAARTELEERSRYAK